MCACQFPDEYGNQRIIELTTIAIVMLTVFGFGTFTIPMLEKLKVRHTPPTTRQRQAGGSPMPTSTVTKGLESHTLMHSAWTHTAATDDCPLLACMPLCVVRRSPSACRPRTP